MAALTINRIAQELIEEGFEAYDCYISASQQGDQEKAEQAISRLNDLQTVYKFYFHNKP